jgi:5-methylcytosine-specific restriction endonuclease McrA
MKPPRPCLERLPDGRGCPNYAVPGGSRCSEHGAKATPSGRITQTARWRKLRRELIAAAPRPLACALCREPIADANDVEVDHIEPVSAGGDPFDRGNLRLTHKRCNRRRRCTPGPHPNRKASLPPWMLGR